MGFHQVEWFTNAAEQLLILNELVVALACTLLPWLPMAQILKAHSVYRAANLIVQTLITWDVEVDVEKVP